MSCHQHLAPLHSLPPPLTSQGEPILVGLKNYQQQIRQLEKSSNLLWSKYFDEEDLNEILDISGLAYQPRWLRSCAQKINLYWTRSSASWTEIYQEYRHGRTPRDHWRTQLAARVLAERGALDFLQAQASKIIPSNRFWFDQIWRIALTEVKAPHGREILIKKIKEVDFAAIPARRQQELVELLGELSCLTSYEAVTWLMRQHQTATEQDQPFLSAVLARTLTQVSQQPILDFPPQPIHWNPYTDYLTWLTRPGQKTAWENPFLQKFAKRYEILLPPAAPATVFRQALEDFKI